MCMCAGGGESEKRRNSFELVQRVVMKCPVYVDLECYQKYLGGDGKGEVISNPYLK